MFPLNTDGILGLCDPPQIVNSMCSDGLAEVWMYIDTQEYN